MNKHRFIYNLNKLGNLIDLQFTIIKLRIVLIKWSGLSVASSL